MCEAGFKPSIHVLQTIIQICEETYDYILVWYILYKAVSLFFFVLYSNPFFSSHNMSWKFSYEV
jgi:hypothetical protein